MWNTKGKRYMAKTYKQHLRGKKLGHTHTKPKRKTRKTKKRRTRRRGGQAPGTEAFDKEYQARIKALQDKRSGKTNISVLDDAIMRKKEQKEGVGLLTTAMTNMQREKNKKQQRQSLPSMPSAQFSTERRRAYTSG